MIVGREPRECGLRPAHAAAARADPRGGVRARPARAMDDGAVLLADRGSRARRAVGRSRRCSSARHMGGVSANLWAPARRARAAGRRTERPWHVRVGRRFSPFDERADGWPRCAGSREQPWHAGRIGMIGASYLGLVQWAVARGRRGRPGGAGDQVSASQFHGQAYAGGKHVARDGGVVAGPRRRAGAPVRAAGDAARAPAAARAARRGADRRPRRRATGVEARLVPRGAGQPAARGRLLGRARLLGGRREGHARRAARRRLVRHLPAVDDRGLRRPAAGRARRRSSSSAHGRTHLPGSWPAARARGSRGCAPSSSGRPAGSTRDGPGPGHRRAQRRRLARAAELAAAGNRRAAALAGQRAVSCRRPSRRTTPEAGDRYRYDPADPTPSLGGPVLLAREPVVDNRALEARADVLTYTTAPLPSTVEASVPCASSSGCAQARRTSTCSRACATSIGQAPRGTSATHWHASTPGRFEQAADGSEPRPIRSVANGPPLRRRPPHPSSGLLGRPSALARNPGHRRRPRHRDQVAAGRPRDCFTARSVPRCSCCHVAPTDAGRSSTRRTATASLAFRSRLAAHARIPPHHPRGSQERR